MSSMRRFVFALALSATSLGPTTAATGDGLDGREQAMSKKQILVHVTHGPEHPTRAALAFLVAKTALDPEGQVLVHGELWTAVAEGPGIPAGERVRVVHVEGLRLRVERASGQTA